MFTIYLNQLRTSIAHTVPGRQEDEFPPSGPRGELQLSSHPIQKVHEQQQQQQQQQQQRDIPSSSQPKVAFAHSRLVDHLQSSMFFGGFGSLSRDIEAMLTPKQSKIATTIGISDVIDRNTAAVQTPLEVDNERTPKDLDISTSVIVLSSSDSKFQQQLDAHAHGSQKRYRVTIEEMIFPALSVGEQHQKELENEVPVVTSTMTTTTNTRKISAIVPAGLLNATLQELVGQTQDRVETEKKLAESELKQYEEQQLQKYYQEQQDERQEKEKKEKALEQTIRVPSARPATLFPGHVLAGSVTSVSDQCDASREQDVVRPTVVHVASTASKANNNGNSVVRDDIISTAPVMVSKVRDIRPSWTRNDDAKLLVTSTGTGTSEAVTVRKDMINVDTVPRNGDGRHNCRSGE
ncbi:hypothetical protein BGX28_006923, partial [Mortierella sp. GBA30]